MREAPARVARRGFIPLRCPRDRYAVRPPAARAAHVAHRMTPFRLQITQMKVPHWAQG